MMRRLTDGLKTLFSYLCCPFYSSFVMFVVMRFLLFVTCYETCQFVIGSLCGSLALMPLGYELISFFC